ncbi:MAG: J domain-containing protein [Actinobacteria bacterium]|nr:J domain-containing protein [Actinomycetota bacterium]
MNHYQVLGVAEDAPASEIRRAYVRLARHHHPDFFVDREGPERLEAERRMRAINQAWSVLGDQGRRRAYDRAQGTAGRSAGGADGSGARPFEPFEADDDDVDPRDLPDEPYHRGPGRDGRLGRAATLAPVAAFGTAVALGALGLVVGSAAMLAMAVAALVVACLGFVVLPLVALSRASRDD